MALAVAVAGAWFAWLLFDFFARVYLAHATFHDEPDNVVSNDAAVFLADLSPCCIPPQMVFDVY